MLNVSDDFARGVFRTSYGVVTCTVILIPLEAASAIGSEECFVRGICQMSLLQIDRTWYSQSCILSKKFVKNVDVASLHSGYGYMLEPK